MKYRDAKKLHNRDEVEVRVGPGEWEPGKILGEVIVLPKMVSVPVLSKTLGFASVTHRDIRRRKDAA